MSHRAGSLFVEVLIVAAIIALLAAAYLGLINRTTDDSGKSMPKAATDKARGIECASNLQQLRAMIQMYVAEHDSYPAALDPNSGLNKCPVSGTLYRYDPQTGNVTCTTPGHEAF